ncbi:MAG: RnfABCDGE type electron transport complex subunit B [Clostridiales bacterium]|jgi:Na+-translocating ferredoxin:NAD+ oxidoreductase RNF subunit RnfB|nr:RnfABCDGE type electron transport complex subunit B [Clostridiales bacterium]
MDISTIAFSALTISGMGLLLGTGLGYAAVKFKVEADERLQLIRDILPGANCGGCGYPGCDAYAEAVVSGSAPLTACSVGGAAVVAGISEIMGVEAVAVTKQVAFVKCNGNNTNALFKYDYSGLNDCQAAMQLAGGGSKACIYGCLGCGSCYNVCRFEAIEFVDGIVKINREKCTACKQCVGACPKSLITLVPYDNYVNVTCNSRDAGKIVRGNCKVGCISCKMCEKACKFDAVHVENNCAIIDYDKCTMCDECVKKCPTSAIVSKTFVKETKA